MLFFQNYSNLYPPNKTLCAHEEKQISELLIIKDAGHVQSITTDYDLYTSKTLLFAKTHEEITN
ncbi:hypothetical protein [Spiroplasma endosymbiont of Dilophus febrilis]|uniref:hypothetical protein n=1 Tax=Spiroplasma endosymbiont of Dilophus febrilis TaxID=3066292 RepID=UPI00313BCEB7